METYTPTTVYHAFSYVKNTDSDFGTAPTRIVEVDPNTRCRNRANTYDFDTPEDVCTFLDRTNGDIHTWEKVSGGFVPDDFTPQQPPTEEPA